MTVSEQSAPNSGARKFESLAGDGLVACGSHHVVVIEMTHDDPSADGLVDAVIVAHDAHTQLMGRSAALSLRRAVDGILAAYKRTQPAIALVSFWDDKAAITLYGRATATIAEASTTTTLDGRRALLANDAIVEACFDYLELHVGGPPKPHRTPISVGQITAGRGLRLVGSQIPRAPAESPDPPVTESELTEQRPLNEWSHQEVEGPSG